MTSLLDRIHIVTVNNTTIIQEVCVKEWMYVHIMDPLCKIHIFGFMAVDFIVDLHFTEVFNFILLINMNMIP